MKYPNMRDELISYLEDLADEDGRQQQWAPNGGEFDEVVHFICDDTPLGRAPSEAIGIFLENDVEAAAVKRLVGAIERLFEVHGTALGNAQVGSHAQWCAVKEHAQELLRILRAT